MQVHFAPRGVGIKAVPQLSFNHVAAKSSISLPNGEGWHELLLAANPNHGHAILRFDKCLFTEEAIHQFLDAYISRGNTREEFMPTS